MFQIIIRSMYFKYMFKYILNYHRELQKKYLLKNFAFHYKCFRSYIQMFSKNSVYLIVEGFFTQSLLYLK